MQIADAPGLRPTSARIRETLFNWLAPGIEGARCLDLFAGTGALGLEALSRGARSCVFVESSRQAAGTLRDNIALLGAEQASLVEANALSFLQQPSADPFDIVFLDPPFDAGLLPQVCELLDRGNILANHARIYVEQDKAEAETDWPARWEIRKSKIAGNVRYSLFHVGSRS